jgi:hypothetical protein
MSSKIQGALAAGVIILVIVAITLVFRRVNASPYGTMSPERIKQAKERIKQGERLGPPVRR